MGMQARETEFGWIVETDTHRWYPNPEGQRKLDRSATPETLVISLAKNDIHGAWVKR